MDMKQNRFPNQCCITMFHVLEVVHKTNDQIKINEPIRESWHFNTYSKYGSVMIFGSRNMFSTKDE